jgi:hypothetical protein
LPSGIKTLEAIRQGITRVCFAPKHRISPNSSKEQPLMILLCIDIQIRETAWIGGAEYISRAGASLIDGTSYEVHGSYSSYRPALVLPTLEWAPR